MSLVVATSISPITSVTIARRGAPTPVYTREALTTLSLPYCMLPHPYAHYALQSLALESVSTCLRLGLGPLGRAPVTQRGLVPGIRECAPPRGVRRCERLRRIVTVIATSTVVVALGRPWLARQVADEVRAEGWLRQHPPFISRARERRRSVLLVRASERGARGPSTRKVTHQLWARS